MPADPRDKRLLARAVALSREHMEKGTGGPFGAVIADQDGRIVSEGWNCVTSGNDPTAHAEITAIRRACESLDRFDLKGHVIYSSCEPCPMCLAAIYWARLDRLIFANSREQAAAIGFDDAAIYAEIPKPLAERSIPTLHQPGADAAQVFADWLKKADRVEY
jgi:tRNA(Arg) A34 adenosine deaminase TadA